jgi:pimeloyl-ACP methyl ester carboxylesterase
VRGAAIEAAWTATHLALYPLGIAREHVPERRAARTLDDLTPVQRGLVLGDASAASTPIVLVHGWVDNRSIFTLLRRQLSRRGFTHVVTLNYSVLTHDVHRAAGRLASLVEELCAATGHDRVHVVGHSMGGLVARYYAQCLGGDDRVHTLVTLGTPHAGTHAARLFVGRALAQLRPGSRLMQELAEPAPGCRTRFVAYWSDIDHVVVPNESARLDHPDLDAREVCVRGVGHSSLPIDGRVVHEIATTLARLENSGDSAPTIATWPANA